jgi:hypothetical protein
VAIQPPEKAVTTTAASDGHQSTPVSPGPAFAAHSNSLFRIALAQFVGNLAALLVGLTLFMFVLVRALRRFGVAPAPHGNRPPGQEQIELPDVAAILAVDPVPTFDLGPTYAEEMRLKQEAAREQEQAMLRQLVEQNLSLQEQISKLNSSGVRDQG